MHLTLEDWILWAAGFSGAAILLAALLWRGAARVFPWFTLWCFYQLCRTTLLFFLHRAGADRMYSKVYWYGQIPELLLLLAVIINMALVLFRPHGKWLPGTRKLVQIGAVVAILVALLLTWLGEPSAPTTLWSWLIRGNLFSAVLTTELALAIILTAFFMGLSWNEWVTGLAVGLMLRFSITCLVEGAHTYLGVGPFYKALVHVRMYAEILALCYWIRTFYRKEPELRPLPPEMLESLARLNRAR